MTRETKVGLVVVGSFLTLVGVVVSQKLRPAADASDGKDEKIVQVSPKKDNPPANDAKPKILPASLLEPGDNKQSPTPPPAPVPATNPDSLANLPGLNPDVKQPLNNVIQQGQGFVNQQTQNGQTLADQVNQQAKELQEKMKLQNQQTAQSLEQKGKDLFNPVLPPLNPPTTQGNNPNPFALPPLAMNNNPPVPAPITPLTNPGLGTLPPVAPLPPLAGLPGIEEKKGDGLPPLSPPTFGSLDKTYLPPVAPLTPVGVPYQNKDGMLPLPPLAPPLPEQKGLNPAPGLPGIDPLPVAPLPGLNPPPVAPLPGLNPPQPEPNNALPPIQNPVPLAPPIPITNRTDLPPINTQPTQGVQPIPNSPVTINMDPSRIPVIGGQTDRTLTPQNFTKPAGQVTSQQTKIETVRQGGESWEALSQGFYGTDRYAQALRSYNRDQAPLMSGLGNQFAGATQFLSPGQRVIIPSTNDLETGYRSQISGAVAQVQAPAPRPGGGLLGQPTPLTPVGGSSGNTAPTADRVAMYRVPAGGKMIQEIAREQLGDRTLWTEIYRLNPNYPPQQPIPGDVTIRIPAR